MEPQSGANPVTSGEEKPVSPVADDVLAELSSITDEPSPADAPVADPEEGDKPVPSLESAERAVEAAEALPEADVEPPKFDGTAPFDTEISDSSGIAPDLSSDTPEKPEDSAVAARTARTFTVPVTSTGTPGGDTPETVPDKAVKVGIGEIFTGSDISAPETVPEVSSETQPEVGTITPEPDTEPEPAASVAVPSATHQDAVPAAAVIPALSAVVTPSVKGDKKTVLILTVIAVVLFIAIAVLYFV